MFDRKDPLIDLCFSILWRVLLIFQVPSYNNDLAMKTIEDELGKPPSELFSEITKDPVAAASLGQVEWH